MQNIDGAFLYETGAQIRPLNALSMETNYLFAYSTIYIAKGSINLLLDNSIYSPIIRQPLRNSGRSLIDVLDAISSQILESDFSHTLTYHQVDLIKNASLRFETLLLAEIQSISLYLVNNKGAFDTPSLINEGYKLFSESLFHKVPDAIEDAMAGSRCMAFELWTAMGFHFHRANESVLRVYYDLIAEKSGRPKMLTMGTMVAHMEKCDSGDLAIRAALKNLITFHRNPISHPGAVISSQDEAISLYAAIRATMGYMLDKLPVLETAASPPLPLPALT